MSSKGPEPSPTPRSRPCSAVRWSGFWMRWGSRDFFAKRSLLRRLSQNPDQLLLVTLQLLGRLSLQHEPQVGLGVRGADVRPPVGVAEGDAVEVVDLGVGEAAGQLV